MPPASTYISTMQGSNLHLCEPGSSASASCSRIPGIANSVQPKRKRGRPPGIKSDVSIHERLWEKKENYSGDDNLSVSGDESDGDSHYNVFAGCSEKKDTEECRNQKRSTKIIGRAHANEAFRGDIIHRVRAGEYNVFEDGDEDNEYCGVKNIKLVDKWREEWSSGVQVPFNSEFPVFHCDSYDLSSFSTRKEFNMPKKRIGKDGKKYVSKNVFKLRNTFLRLYEGDRLDEIWISKYNNIRASRNQPVISMHDLLTVVNEFEVDCFKNIHNALLEPLHSPAVFSSDEDAACDICRMAGCEDDDEMVYCDGCNLCVHLSCYGLQEVPDDDWMCMTCVLRFGRRAPCLLCPVIGGAMKCTQNVDAWVHIVCVLFVPEARFVDDLNRENVYVGEAPDERWKWICSICDLREGACIQCSEKSCHATFHASCAQRKGYDMRIEEDPTNTAEDGVRFTTFCKKHSTKPGESKEIVENGGDSLKLDENFDDLLELKKMESNFFLYVDLQKVSERLYEMNLDSIFLSDIYEFWKLKRQRNFGRPLIKNAHDEISLKVSDDFFCTSISPHIEGAHSDVNLSVFQENRRIWDILRFEAEKRRNLHFQQEKREKLKSMIMQTDTDIINKVLEIANAPVAISQRLIEILKGEVEKIMTSAEIDEARRLCKDNELDGAAPGSTDGPIPVIGNSPPKLCSSPKNVSPTKSSSGDSLKEQMHSPKNNGENQNKNTAFNRLGRKRRSLTVGYTSHMRSPVKRLKERNELSSILTAPRKSRRSAI